VVCRLWGFLSAVLLAAVVALALVSRSASAGGVVVRVEPAAGGPGTTFVVSFTAPARTGVIGSMRLRDELNVETTSAVRGCLARASERVPDARRGQLPAVHHPVHRHLGHPHDGGDLGHRQKLDVSEYRIDRADPGRIRRLAGSALGSLAHLFPDTFGTCLVRRLPLRRTGHARAAIRIAVQMGLVR